jgi:hypothetical protein
MLRQRQSTFNTDTASNLHSTSRASRSPSNKFVFGAIQGLSDFEHEAAVRSPSNQTNPPLAPKECAQNTSNSNVIGNQSSDDYSPSRLDDCDMKASEQTWDQQHLNTQDQQERSLHLNSCSPRNRLHERVNIPVSSMNPSASDLADGSCERLHVVVQRANAALAASGALSKELSEASSFHVIDAKHSFTSSTLTRSPGSPGISQQLFSQKPRSFTIATNDGIDSCVGSSSVENFLSDSIDQSREVFTALNVSDRDDHTGVSMKIPKSANSAPILMIRRGSSNSSSGSTHSSRLESLDDSNHIEHRKRDSNVCVEQCVKLLQRQKLRSGTDALRPKSAGRDTRKSVRPDLASGLGFKTIDAASRTTSVDAVRVRQSNCLLCIRIPHYHLSDCRCLLDLQLLYLLVMLQLKRTSRTQICTSSFLRFVIFSFVCKVTKSHVATVPWRSVNKCFETIDASREFHSAAAAAVASFNVACCVGITGEVKWENLLHLLNIY